MFKAKPYNDAQPSPQSFASTRRMVNNESDGSMPVDYAFFQTKRFKICFLAMCLNVILFALDQLIITVAVPQILDEFNALDKVEWLNTAFFIPCAGAVLVYTQIMTVAPPKWTYLVAVTIFEAGSAICGAAQSMNILIVGRAVAGLGGAGMWNATYYIGGELVPFEKRPGYFSMFGVNGLAMVLLYQSSVSSPKTSLNCSIGAVTLLLLAFTLPSIRRLPRFDGQIDNRSMFTRIATIDWISVIFTIGFVTCLGIGLQWGGISKDWKSAAVITTLTLSAVLFLVLIGWNLFLGKKGMVPLSLLRRRHFVAGIWVSFFTYGIVVVYLYFLPLYFEAIKGKTATRAGVLLLGMQLSMCPFLIISGKLAERTGQAKIFIIAGAPLVAAASGLLMLINKSTSLVEIIAFEVIAGIGIGIILNIMVILVQADYLTEPHLVPHVTNVFNFWGFVGRIVAMSTATNIFENKLKLGLRKIDQLPQLAISAVEASPKALWTVVPAEMRDQVLDLYSKSLNQVWWLCLSFAGSALVAGLLMRNLNLKDLGDAAVRARSDSETSGYPMTPPTSQDKSTHESAKV